MLEIPKLLFFHVLLYCVGTAYGNAANNGLLPDIRICGIGTESKIFGGQVTKIDEFPWTALLQREYSNFSCGGTLISSRYVLTAAHCLDVEPIVNVRLGEHNLDTAEDCDDTFSGVVKPSCSKEPLDIPVEKAIKHNKYNRRRRVNTNDIALLRLGTEVKFNKFVKPICLPIIELSEFKIGVDATVAGWGRTETRAQSPVKLKVEVPIIENDKCLLPTDAGQICAGGDKGKDSCAGDSGGPLMVHKDDDEQSNWYIIGVVSSGSRDCASEGVASIYTKVADYVDWIVDNLEP